MLVLTRKVGEQIIIDGSIYVTITEVAGNQVRIGITAPPAVRVHRAEIHQRIQELGETNSRANTMMEHANGH